MELEEYIAELEREANRLPSGPTRDEQLSQIKHLYERYNGEDRIVTSQELVSMMEAEPPVHLITTEFPGLNAIIGGFSYEQLIVVSAQEKTGKTEFVLQLAESLKDQHPCYFLFEQSARELIRQRIDRGQPIPYFETPLKNTESSLKWIFEKCLEAMVKKGSRVFIIDNSDWVEKAYQNKNQRSDEVVRDMLLELKNFCKKWGIVIILVAHVRKCNMEDIPQPNDIKDTTAFKQIADTVLILWRKTKSETVEGTKTKAIVRTNETLLWVAENRRTGKTGYVQLKFDGKQLIESQWDFALAASQHANEITETW